jgi:hypothetical protein
MKLTLRSLIFIALVLCYQPSTAAEQLRMVTGQDGIAAYAKGVLKIILSKLPEGKYQWDDSADSATEARIVQMVQDGDLEICWYATTREFEERLQPIRIPLYKGLLGYRVFMIKQGNQHLFRDIKTLNDLKGVSIGQGRAWADTLIMEANGLDVVKVTMYDGLFYMLDGDRFQAFPRGVHEPWAEMKRWPDLALTVEESLLMQYINPFYFFVQKGNDELYRDIEQGFRTAIEDGSFNEYFLADPTINDVINRANLQNRTVIKIENPLLPEQTPVNDLSLWFDPRSI